MTLVTIVWSSLSALVLAGSSADIGGSQRGGTALLSYGLDMIESCFNCKMRADRIFCDLPTIVLRSFEAIKYATAYKGAVLFVEGRPRAGFSCCARGG